MNGHENAMINKSSLVGSGTLFVIPSVFFQYISNAEKEFSFILDVNIPLLQEAIYLFERRYYMFSGFSIQCQIKGFHVHKEPAVWILQQIVQIKQAGKKKYTNMRQYSQNLISQVFNQMTLHL